MQRVLHSVFAAACFLSATISLRAQSPANPAIAQEDFALAVATAHARTSLVTAGSKPFFISAKVVSSLALRATGNGMYQNSWVDNQHWRRDIQFPGFEESEMRNDSGHSWFQRSSETVPLRVMELLSVVMIHVPNSAAAATVPVTETSAIGDHDEALTCYSAARPTPEDGFPRLLRFCFEKATGLLVTEDAPLNTHIVYSNYIAFQGKNVYTHVHVTASGLPVLDIQIQYAPLEPHALDASVPGPAMQRSATAASAPNPEEIGKGSMEYRFSPPLPPGTPDAVKNKSVQLQFQVDANHTVLDACLEEAPTQAMAEAALQAATKFTFIPATVDGKPIGARLYYPVWFRSGADNGSAPPDTADNHPATTTAAPQPPSSSSSVAGIYRSQEPSYVFRYPAGFEEIPKGQTEEELRASGHRYGLEPGVECRTILLRVQRHIPDTIIPEVLSINDLAPTCIFGAIDQKGLENSAANAARRYIDQWAQGSASRPVHYTANGKTFAIVTASGTTRGTVPQPIHLVIVVTSIHYHLVVWTIIGPKAHPLAQTLAASTLQIGEGEEGPLTPPLSNKP
ncbi:MAG: hypothetical protein V4555_12120 [Acidobacteriota bacterium]